MSFAELIFNIAIQQGRGLITKIYIMKNYLIPGLVFAIILCFLPGLGAQTTTDMNYTTDWVTIDSLENQGLPKSALEKTILVLEKAKTDNNAAQIIKSLLYREKFRTQLEEDGYVKAIYELENEIAAASFPAKPILESILAEIYANYLDQHYWELQDRSVTSDFKNEDIRTWDMAKLSTRAFELYKNSLSSPDLIKVPIENFESITIPGKYDEGLRPTLYDFLAHRTLDYFSNERSYLTEPVYKFFINNPLAYAPARQFINWKIETRDTSSLKYQAILIIQEIMAHHINDADPTALIDADLARLAFIHNEAVVDNKNILYINTLEDLRVRYADLPAYAEISFQLASHYFNNSSDYKQGGDQTFKWDWRKALEICDEVISRFPNSYGARFCVSLKKDIEAKSFSVQTEEVNLPGKPILAKINYRSIGQVYFKVFKISEQQRKDLLQLNSNDYYVLFANQKEVLQWSESLPLDGDYREHSTEFKIDKLPLGYYILAASEKEDLSDKAAIRNYVLFHVSNIAHWNRLDENNLSEFVMVDRTNGNPLKGVVAEFYAYEYNADKRINEYKKVGNAVSDANGRLYPRINSNSYFTARFSYGKDTLFTQDSYSNYRYRDQPQIRKQTHFFLDRAIYRPGQTVYFKGLLMQYSTSGLPEILPNTGVTITFRDANYQEVTVLKLRSNAYGTVNGTLIAPLTGLLGQMSINSDVGGSEIYFNVEEYKRPRFEVNIDPVKGSYRLGDKVTVTGKAQAYAGSNVDGAKVAYRVVREVRFPWLPWWYWRGYNPYSGSSMEITNGVTSTKADGTYEIIFDAVPDKSVPDDKKPQFSYTVYVDVTDITGETHSTSGVVNAGFIAINVNVDIPEKVNREKAGSFPIVATNLNGNPENTKGDIRIWLLDSPRKPFTKRYWDKPDTTIMSKNDFIRHFPTYAYQEEDELQEWKKKSQVYQGGFDTGMNTNLKIDSLKRWLPGNYVMELNSQDAFGTPVSLTKYFTLYDLDDKVIPINASYWDVMEKTVFEPKDTVLYYIGTAEDDIKVLMELERNNTVITSQWVDIKGLEMIDFKIEEADRGNIFYHISFVKNNRSFHLTKNINVPWSNKDLKIEYSTFRDKLLPGQDEEWRIKISGNKKELIAAELLATMYDASLDEFAVNSWNKSFYPYSYPRKAFQTRTFNGVTATVLNPYFDVYNPYDETRYYRQLNWFNFNLYAFNDVMVRGGRDLLMAPNVKYSMAADEAAPAAAPMMANGGNARKMEETIMKPVFDSENVPIDLEEQTSTTPPVDLSQVKARTNLKETVFFFPDLMTDANGDVILKFKMNEALTRWKFLGFAHTLDFKYGFTEQYVVTQKDLMVIPNPPRFMREGDMIEFSAKVSNLTDSLLNGNASLMLFDALTMQPVDYEFDNRQSLLTFSADAKQSALLTWQLKVPYSKVTALTWRVVAQAGDFSDGEENSLPVLTNRMLVTESLPMPVRGGQTKTFTLQSLKDFGYSKTQQPHRLTLEFTSNPAWYAVQALPYLMEYPYDCTEQVFSRFYANTLATTVANAHPKIKAVFEQWKNQPEALLSNLSKNQELKTALLEDTPWVLDALNEEQQKKNIGLLFDFNKMASEQRKALDKITERQLSNGGFAWFPGGRDSWYITQYIVEGMGHLQQLKATDYGNDDQYTDMLFKAVGYIDARIVDYYNELERNAVKYNYKMEDDHLDGMAIHYLYARSFFLDRKPEGEAAKVYAYFLEQAEKYWLNKGLYQEGMIALALHRADKPTVPAKIVASLKERSLNSEEMGMYWKYEAGYWWYQMPIETHALLIEVFADVAKDMDAVDNLKVWLLKNKQTNSWKTTKATSSAVYALLMNGDNWLMESETVKIKLGDKELDQTKISKEAGTGYFKTAWSGNEIQPAMGTIQVENPNKVVAWGGIYWQYFEDLDKIKTFKETPLMLDKQLFKIVNTPTGPVITPVTDSTELHQGDQLKVRIELRVDRPMEYVHMKDMRASGFEPVNVFSQYKWQGGLGYYESTKDAATNFFFDYLPKGTFVFEYPLTVNLKGDFSAGITTIQCMYAPEFSSHSAGERVRVQ